MDSHGVPPSGPTEPQQPPPPRDQVPRPMLVLISILVSGFVLSVILMTQEAKSPFLHPPPRLEVAAPGRWSRTPQPRGTSGIAQPSKRAASAAHHQPDEGKPPLTATRLSAMAAPPPLPPLEGSTFSPSLQLPDLILVTIDALRADHLPDYGYSRNTAPNLSRWAKDAFRFKHAFAHASETQWSLPALMTGQFPPGPTLELVPPAKGLAARLRTRGYRTGAFVSNAWLDPERGYADGFDVFESLSYVYPPPHGPSLLDQAPSTQHVTTPIRVDGGTLVHHAISWLEASNQPTFLWLHLMDVHSPYQPPPPHWGTFKQLQGRDLYNNGPMPRTLMPIDISFMKARYDEGILYADTLLSPLWSLLETPSRRSRTLTVITADHGEEFGEHGGLGHGTSLYLEQLHVPLYIKLPGGGEGATTLNQVVALSDIAPTLLEAAGAATILSKQLEGSTGVPAPGPSKTHSRQASGEMNPPNTNDDTKVSFSGQSLLGLLWSSKQPEVPQGCLERVIPLWVLSGFNRREIRGGLGCQFHWFFRENDRRMNLYRWIQDGGERHTLTLEARRLNQRLRHLTNVRLPPSRLRIFAPPLNPGKAPQLKALGYVGDP